MTRRSVEEHTYKQYEDKRRANVIVKALASAQFIIFVIAFFCTECLELLNYKTSFFIVCVSSLLCNTVNVIILLYRCFTEKSTNGYKWVLFCSFWGMIVFLWAPMHLNYIDWLFFLSSKIGTIAGVLGVVLAVAALIIKGKETNPGWKALLAFSAFICLLLLAVYLSYDRIPNVKNLPVDQAETALLKEGFHISMRDQKVNKADYGKFVVQDQDPDENSIHCRFVPVVLIIR